MRNLKSFQKVCLCLLFAANIMSIFVHGETWEYPELEELIKAYDFIGGYQELVGPFKYCVGTTSGSNLPCTKQNMSEADPFRDSYEGMIFSALLGTTEMTRKFGELNYPSTTFFPAPYLAYNRATKKVELQKWDSSDPLKFQFKVHYPTNFPKPFLMPSLYLLEKDRDSAVVGYHPQVDINFGMIRIPTPIDALPYSTSPSMATIAGWEPKSDYKRLFYEHGVYSWHWFYNYCAQGVVNCDYKPNSYCQNYEGGSESYSCRCIPNFKEKNGQCVPNTNDVRLQLELYPNFIRFKYERTYTNATEEYFDLRYSVFDTTNPSQPYVVFGAADLMIEDAQNTYHREWYTVENLRPGTNYSIVWEMLDKQGNKVMNGRETEPTLFVTSCTCQFGESDAPIIPQEGGVVQSEGFVYFNFVSNSICAESFKLTRQHYSKEDGSLTLGATFVPNFYISDHSCSATPFQPGIATADNLKISDLQVGDTYRYNIQGTRTDYESDIASVDHIVSWEASVLGSVTLAYGSVPVEGVRVEWKLFDPKHTQVLRSGNVTSTVNGNFEIHFKEIPDKNTDFTNDGLFPIELFFLKKTSSGGKDIFHKFLCGDGEVDCTGSGSIAYLKHLHFNTPVDVIDATSIPVAGKVYLANTKLNPDGMAWGEEGCPMKDIEVCITDKSPSLRDSEITCVKTASDGTYAVPATIGTKVGLVAKYSGHKFEYAAPFDNILDVEDGFTLEVDRKYEMQNFVDITEQELDITLAGGLCDAFLGEATMQYKVIGCPWAGKVLTLQQVVGRFALQADNMQVEVKQVVARPDIILPPQNIDLTEVFNSTDADGDTTILSDKNLDSAVTRNATIPNLRFQYDGITEIRAEILGDRNNGCAKPPSKDADALFVLPFQSPLNAVFYLTKNLGNGISCDNLDPTMSVQIQNNLGLLPEGQSGDSSYREILLQKYPAYLIQLMEHCNDGCTMNITKDYDTILQRYARSRVEFPFMTSRPNKDAPYTKLLSVTTNEANPVTYLAEVVITGQYKISDLFSVGLPMYEPLLILRQPPGGDSSAFYENVQTTVRLENYDYEEYTGMDTEIEIGAGGSGDISVCAGVGVQQCLKIFKMKSNFAATSSATDQYLKAIESHVYTGGFTTTWSYTSSALGGYDVFVVPNLNVKYSTTALVKWNDTKCEAWQEMKTTFNVESPFNVPALSFVTSHEIETVELKELSKIVKDLEEKLKNPESETKKLEYQQSLDAAKSAITGWQGALAMNDQAKQAAVDDMQKLVTPSRWFEKIASKQFNDKNSISTAGMSHDSSIVSENLQRSAVLRGSYNTSESTSTDINNINTIKFSGGGPEITYTLRSEKVEEHVTKLGKKNDNSAQESSTGLLNENEMEIGPVSITTKFEGKGTISVTHSHLQTDEAGKETSIGFTLSDNNIGDYFDVQVFIDPHFGTFIFSTLSGRSMCPYEANTVSRLQPELTITRSPSYTVLEDDPMEFVIGMKNTGISGGSFVLVENYHEYRDALKVFPVLPRTVEYIEAGETVYTTIEIRRDAMHYEFDPLVLRMVPLCEYMDDNLKEANGKLEASIELYNQPLADGTKKLVFARPCPRVTLEGILKSEKQFIVSTVTNNDGLVNVVVRNPISLEMTLHEAAQQEKTRVESVRLLYRHVGEVSWSVGQRFKGDKLVDIDFTMDGAEDSYGFVTVQWAAGELMDGQYEMRIVTDCETITSAPMEFNQYQSETILGSIDRTTPELFQDVLPVRSLQVGEPIVYQFDELLSCSKPYSFDVFGTVLSDQGNRTLSKENLLIKCERDTIKIQFKGKDRSSADFTGSEIHLSLSNVRDMAGNLAEETITYDAQIVPRT